MRGVGGAAVTVMTKMGVSGGPCYVPARRDRLYPLMMPRWGIRRRGVDGLFSLLFCVIVVMSFSGHGVWYGEFSSF